MLHAIMQKVKERFPNAIFAMETSRWISSEKLAEHKIFQVKRRRAGIIPKIIRRKLGFVLREEITVVLDGSGFAFGDQWGAAYAERRLGRHIGAWRQQGKKVILLPQAFGPFSNPELNTVMEKIVANTDLIFAREERSFHYLKSLANYEHIKQAPDFTNLIKGKVPADFDARKMQVAIIPNRKMIDKKEEAGSHYMQFLHTAINKVNSLGLHPYFLIHEGKRDIDIANEVNAMLRTPIPVIIDPNPLVIKGIISTAYFIICSRFHGVVSALSHGVPCISTSWSHKYEMLHQEYDFEEGLVLDIKSKEEIEQMIATMADPSANKTAREKLLRNSAVQKQRSTQMWETVFAALLHKKEKAGYAA